MCKFLKTIVDYLVGKTTCEMSIIVEENKLYDVMRIVDTFRVKNENITLPDERSIYYICNFKTSNNMATIIADLLEDELNARFIVYNGYRVICIVEGEEVEA